LRSLPEVGGVIECPEREQVLHACVELGRDDAAHGRESHDAGAFFFLFVTLEPRVQ